MWSLWVFWDEGMTTHKGWYINIDAPYRQTRFGFDTWDMFLDVIVEQDANHSTIKMKMSSLNRLRQGLLRNEKQPRYGPQLNKLSRL